jgi:hypothetical protein
MSPEEAFALLQRWWSPVPVLEGSRELREKAAKLAAVGRENLLAARSTRDQRLAASAASLYGAAIAHFAEAKALLDPDRSEAPDAAAVAPATVVAASTARRLSAEQKADAVLLMQDPQAASTIPWNRRRRAFACLERVGLLAAREVYPLSDSEVRYLGIRRTAAVVVVGLAAIFAAVAWAKSPHNVARGKPVTVSSLRMGSAQALTNGAIEWGTFGLHTGGSGREWAMIDLQKFYALDYAEIYSRGDGRFEFNIPLAVELSADGTSFKQAGACKEPFTQATPCVVELHRERARYVRVVAPEVVLAEVEVYGKP